MNNKILPNTNTIVASAQTLLGAFLFVAPWLVGFDTESAAAWTAWITGLLVFVMGVFSFADENETWPAWVNFFFGAWSMMAGWLVPFPSVQVALWTHLVVGGLVSAASIWKLYVSQMKPHVTA
jgi:hypothetical protein